MKSARKNIPGLEYATIRLLGKLIKTQKVSPVEVVDVCLQQIEDLDPKLNAFITILADQAREKARTAEAEIKAGKWRGPLHGIPVGIKDFLTQLVSRRLLVSRILTTEYLQKTPWVYANSERQARSSSEK